MELLGVFASVFLGFLLIETVTGRVKFKSIGWQDNLLDVLSLLQATVIVRPIVAIGSAALVGWLVPDGQNSLAATPLWLQFVGFLVLDDMVQYWWHRAAHTFPLLWPLHRVHHAAPYLGIRVWLRNGLFYVLLMPNLWLSGLLIYLGFGKVYVAYYLLKVVVTAAAHSEVRWDSWLYRHRWLHPLAWVVERTISTPATHFAHHALHDDDGVGHYKGNFSNLLFIWDVLFGTALITRQYPPAFGLEEDRQQGTEHWYVQWLYPLFRSRRARVPSPPAVPEHAPIEA